MQFCLAGHRADGRFIVRNSWGTTRGDKGLVHVSTAYINVASFDESHEISLYAFRRRPRAGAR